MPTRLLVWRLWAGYRSADTANLIPKWEISLDQFKEANQKWWEYWHTYWDRRFTTDAMPHNYACEVTIPTKNFGGIPDDPSQPS